jgi:hypothetical protein
VELNRKGAEASLISLRSLRLCGEMGCIHHNGHEEHEGKHEGFFGAARE